MIDVAARARDGVNIPGRKQARNEILKAFKDQLITLRERLNVGYVFFSDALELTT